MNVIIAVFLDFYNVEQDRHQALVEERSVPWRQHLNNKVCHIQCFAANIVLEVKDRPVS